LGPLADNGGPTQTQALGAGSPAIGAVTSGPDCLGTDQRGAGRLSGHCDAGAYELAPPNWGAAAQVLGVGTTTATLLAFINNPDVMAGTAMLQYGTSTAYGSSTPPVALPAVHAPLDDIAFLSGLTPDTVYHYRAVATNPDGTVYGPDQQFMTAAPAPSPSPPPAATSPAPPPNTFAFGKAKVASGGRITLPVHAPDAGRFVAKATFTVRLKHRTITITYGTAGVPSTGAGTFKLVIGLSARAAHELKLLGRRQLTIAVTFTPVGGTAHRQTTHVAVKRSRAGRYA